MDTCCIIIHGEILEECLIYYETLYKNIKNKIYITWKNEKPKYIEEVKKYGFHILTMDFPKNPSSYNIQFNGLLQALTYAENELKCSYAIRLRNDMEYMNIDKMLDLLNLKYRNNKLSIMGYTGFGNYIIDYVFFGPIHLMKKVYYFVSPKNDKRFAEKILQESYFNRANILYKDVKEEFNFFAEDFLKNNIDFIWRKPTDKIRTTRNSPIIECFYKHKFLINLMDVKL